MVYRGLARNGVIVLDEGITLPDGAVVTVHFTDLDPLTPTIPSTYDSHSADRLLDILHRSTAESRRAQQHLDRHL